MELCCACCRISMVSRTRLICQCGMDVMRLLSSQLILCCCCCCACFTMADLSPSPSRWQALCSLILVLKLLPFPRCRLCRIRMVSRRLLVACSCVSGLCVCGVTGLSFNTVYGQNKVKPHAVLLAWLTFFEMYTLEYNYVVE